MLNVHSTRARAESHVAVTVIIEHLGRIHMDSEDGRVHVVDEQCEPAPHVGYILDACGVHMAVGEAVAEHRGAEHLARIPARIRRD